MISQLINANIENSKFCAEYSCGTKICIPIQYLYSSNIRFKALLINKLDREERLSLWELIDTNPELAEILIKSLTNYED